MPSERGYQKLAGVMCLVDDAELAASRLYFWMYLGVMREKQEQMEVRAAAWMDQTVAFFL